jgi:hypothetical protein
MRPGAQLFGRARLPFGLLAHGGLHVDARLDRLRCAQRVAVDDALELAMIAQQHNDGASRPRDSTSARRSRTARGASLIALWCTIALRLGGENFSEATR